MAGRLLLVDDEPDVLESTALLLRAEGYDVEETTSWRGVEDAVARGGFDAVLHDVQMPGLEVCEQVGLLRKADARVVVLLFTAAADAPNIARRAGADGAVAKPFDLDALVRRLEELRRIRSMV